MAKPVKILGKDTDVEDLQSDQLNHTFFALSDPTRRAILERLGEESLLVSELAQPFDMSLQAISRHIKILVRAGLVSQERTGRISRCQIDVGPIYAAAVWINRYSKYWQAQFDSLVGWLDMMDDSSASTATIKTKPSGRRTKRKSKRKSK